MTESEDLNKFPITQHLKEICDSLKNSKSRFLVLTAETGAGKSTILPLGLLENFNGRILMTEPRRLAVLGVANRVANLLNEECGNQVGYKIHLENKTSNKTRLEILTEAILLRQLQKDPALEDVSVVVIDEFHERSIYTDLNLAFLKEAMELRDDLYVIIMSATIDTEKICNYLNKSSDSVPLIKIPGRTFPVKIEYRPNIPIEKIILQEIEKIQTSQGILVFLPGIKEIRNCQNNLIELLPENFENSIEISILHSSISLNEQKYVISGGNQKTKRIILASAIAETSLTVPKIVCVIDSGLARVNRINASVGMENLITETESDFSAEQRCGRAGREGPGKCIRLWGEFEPRIKEMPPEILRADLSELVLECADRGIFNPAGIDWLDQPGNGNWKSCTKLLQNLQLIREDGRITEKGKKVLSLGIGIRLGSMAIEAYFWQNQNQKAEVLNKAEKLLLKYSSYSNSNPEIQKKFLQDLHKRLSKIQADNFIHSQNFINSPNLLILAGFPDRLAKRISEVGLEKSEYQFPSGRKAILTQAASEWIVAPEVLAGKSEGFIFSFETLNSTEILSWLNENSQKKEICCFENGKIKKNEVICYEEIILSEKRIPSQKDDLLNAWINEIQKKGFESLPIDKKTENLLNRGKFYFQQQKLEFPDLANSASEWLPPFLNNSTQLNSEIVYNALYWFLDGQKIDKEVPEFYRLPNNSKCKIEYLLQSSPEDKNSLVYRPVIQVIIQRIFGCKQTPEIMGMKVLLKLLSPASRPLQVTDDLEGFWSGAWIEICKEMKGRYPKHCWDPNIICKE